MLQRLVFNLALSVCGIAMGMALQEKIDPPYREPAVNSTCPAAKPNIKPKIVQSIKMV